MARGGPANMAIYRGFKLVVFSSILLRLRADFEASKWRLESTLTQAAGMALCYLRNVLDTTCYLERAGGA